MEAVQVNNTGKIMAVPVGPITVDKIQKNAFTGNQEAQIRQLFKKSYPSQKTSNEFKDSLFSNEELGIEETDYEEARVAWIPVGKKHKDKDVQKALDATPTATIYKVLSFAPILTSDQTNVLKNGLSGDSFESFIKDNDLDKESWDAECSRVLLDKIAKSQLVVDEDENEVTYQGRKQYRQVFFSLTARPDLDWRVEEKQEMPDLVLATQEVEVEA